MLSRLLSSRLQTCVSFEGMSPLVYDQYRSDARVTLSVVLVAGAVALAVEGLTGLAGVVLLAAAIAFHVEWRLTIDPDSRTIEHRVMLKPFGKAQNIPFVNVGYIELSTVARKYGVDYRARLVFRSGPSPYTLVSGSVGKVMEVVERLHRDTGFEIKRTGNFEEMRREFDKANSLMRRNP
jgi:hypothetical protein